MLPFMKRRAETGIAVTYRKPDENSQVSSEPSPLEACAKDIIEAISASDHKRLAMALQAAFDVMDSAEDASEGE